jgi:hypothetical protein
MPISRICVFCGSSAGKRDSYAEAARSLGSLLAERSIGLVYGGASVGLMGAVADATLERGGEVVGVIPQRLVDREIAHPGLSELRVVGSMHERKALMADLSDAFVALPGGAGTLDELFEAWTWGQLGLHRKPCGLLDVDAFFGPLLALADHLTEEGFLSAESRRIVLVDEEPARLLDRLEAYEPPPEKWAAPFRQATNSTRTGSS